MLYRKGLYFRVQGYRKGYPAGTMKSKFSGPLDDAMKRLNHLAPGNHERRWIAFRFVQDTNAALAQQRNTSGEGRVAYEVHLQTGNSNNWRSPAPQSFTQDTGC